MKSITIYFNYVIIFVAVFCIPYAFLDAQVGWQSTSGNDGQYILGKVGIGTTNPTYNLVVGDGTGLKMIKVAGGRGSAIGGTVLVTDGTSSVSMGTTNAAVGGDVGSSENYIQSIGGIFRLGTGDSQSLFLVTGGWYSARLAINSTGNVGIGTISPGYKLSVNGVIQGQSGAGTGDVLLIGNDTKLVDIDVANTAGLYGLSDATVAGLRLGSSARTLITSVANTASYFNNGGKVGIGTSNPAYNLEVGDGTGLKVINVSGGRGSAIGGLVRVTDGTSIVSMGTTNATVGGDVGSSENYIQSWGGLFRLGTGDAQSLSFVTGGWSVRRLTINSIGNVGIGTTSPLSKLDISGGVAIGSYSGVNAAPSNGIIVSGNVGIGTTTTGNCKLAVEGMIGAREVQVVASGWPDYVFDDTYKLTALDEVEYSIKTDKHLPGIPSKEEVAKDGVKLGEMQTKLLQKVEELTLYVIEQNKRIEKLEKENRELKK